jgi:hypothetical protein
VAVTEASSLAWVVSNYQFTTSTVQPFAQMLTLLHGGDQANFTLKDLMDAEVFKESTEIILESTMI